MQTIEERKQVKYEELKKTYNIISTEADTIDDLCHRAAFMLVDLEELEKDIQKNGIIIKTKNGNGFEVVSENPAHKTYNITIKSYNQVIRLLRQMTGITPEYTLSDPGEEFFK